MPLIRSDKGGVFRLQRKMRITSKDIQKYNEERTTLSYSQNNEKNEKTTFTK